jgi:hypothetical protein
LEKRGTAVPATNVGVNATLDFRNTDGKDSAVTADRSYQKGLLGKHIMECENWAMQNQSGWGAHYWKGSR